MPSLPRIKGTDNYSQQARKINDSFAFIELLSASTLTTISPTSAQIMVIDDLSGSIVNKSIATHYSSATPFQITGEGVLTIPADNKVVKGINFSNSGAGYSSAPTLAFSDPYTVSAWDSGTSYSINNIVFVIGGDSKKRFYKATTSISSGGSAPTHASGITSNWLMIGRTAVATVTISAGGVNSSDITDNGFGYTAAPTITFTGGGFSTVAVATALMYSDIVFSLNINSILNKPEIVSLTDNTRATDFLLVYDSSSLKKIKISTITPDVPTGSVLFGSPTDSYTWDSTNFHWDDTNNRLGLGTNTPAALLTVNGVGAFGNGSVSVPSISNIGYLTTGFSFPAADTIAASTAGVEIIRITSTGNVGIGTTSPAVKFQVAGASSSAIIRINSTDTSPADLQFTTTQGSAGIGMGIYSGTGFTNNLQFNAAGFHFITGNVGIGTASPSEKLHIVGSGAAAIIDSTSVASANPELRLAAVGRQFNVGVGGGTFATTSLRGSYYLYDVTAAEYRFVIDVSGRVGIGTTTPAYKLDVAGDLNLASTYVYRISGNYVLSANTLGSGVLASSLTSVGTITTGTWNGTAIAGLYGGTGVANSGKTITLGGNLTTSGAFAVTLNATATTSVILPTSGTLATLAGAETLTNKTIAAGSNTISGLVNANLSGTAGIINANLANSAVTIGSTSISLGASSLTLAGLTSVSATTFTGALAGNASTTTSLATPRNFSLGGVGSDVTSPVVSFNGTGDVQLVATIISSSLPEVEENLQYVKTITSSTASVIATSTLVSGTQASNVVLSLDAPIAGAGLTFTSGIINVIGTTNRILVNADSIDISPSYVGQASITTLGTIASGVWNGTAIVGQYGGTGVDNSGKTITLGGNLTTSGAFAVTLTASATTSVTLPTSGTLVNTAGTGAAGTWGINVTGSAATATTSTNATNLTGGGTISATSASISNRLTVSPGSSTSATIANATASLGAIEVSNGGSTNAAFISFNRTSLYSGYFGLDSDNVFKIGGASFGSVSYVVLHSSNFNTYSPTLTGTGASGTWGINVTGNAATVTNGVYTTGTQTIGGAKTFSSNAAFSGNVVIAGASHPGALSVLGGGTAVTTLATSRSLAVTSIQTLNTSGWLLTTFMANDNPSMQVVDQSGTAAGNLNLMPFGGSVGIGSTAVTSGAKLDVSGTITIRGTGTDPGFYSALFMNDAVAPYTTYLAGYTLGFNTGGNNARSTRMYIDNAGLVGIGTTDPISRLALNGVGQVTASIDTTATLGATLFLSDSTATGGSGGMILFGAAQNSWRFAAIKGFATNGNGNTQGDIVFSTRRGQSDATLTESMRIVANGNLHHNASVGIGAAPGVKLDVTGASSTAIIRINSTDTSPANLLFATTQGTASLGMGIVSGTGFTNNLQFNAAGFHFQTGNVGIGDTNPQYKLYVNGTLLVSGAATFSSTVTATTFTGALAGNAATATNATTAASCSGNAASVTNGVYTIGDQTIGGTKTFSSTIVASITGNAATATTATNLSGFTINQNLGTANSPTFAGLTVNSTIAASINGNAATATTAASCSGNAASVTNGVYTIGDQTIGGTKTFSSTVNANITGTASINIPSSSMITWTAGGSLSAGTVNFINITSASQTLTLPASPPSGSKISFYPVSSSIVNYTIARNGSTIMGLSQDLIVDLKVPFDLIYSGLTWVLA